MPCKGNVLFYSASQGVGFQRKLRRFLWQVLRFGLWILTQQSGHGSPFHCPYPLLEEENVRTVCVQCRLSLFHPTSHRRPLLGVCCWEAPSSDRYEDKLSCWCWAGTPTYCYPNRDFEQREKLERATHAMSLGSQLVPLLLLTWRMAEAHE